MKTLKEMIIERKLRKGPAHDTTKRGAYWTQDESHYFATLRRSGGDVSHLLDFRHYRSGDVTAIIVADAYHQNGSSSGGGKSYVDANRILDCTTIEDVMVVLKALSSDEGAVVGFACDIEEKLAAWGMPEALPAPDDEAAKMGTAADQT